MIVGGAVSNHSPFEITEYLFNGETSLTGKVAVSGDLTPGEKTLVLLSLGQSLATNVCGPAYTPTTPLKIHQLNIYDGLIYRAADPLLGTVTTANPRNYLTVLADKIVTAATIYQRVILIPIAIGGSLSIDWSPTFQASNYANSTLTHRLQVALLRMRPYRWTESPDVTWKVAWQQGQADGAAGTSSAVYQQAIRDIVSFINSFGMGKPKFYVARDTWNNGTLYPTIQGAQGAVVDGVQIIAGPNTDSLLGVDRIDNTHLNSSGAGKNADMWMALL